MITAIRKTIKAVRGIEEKVPGGALAAVLIFGREPFAIFEYQGERSAFSLAPPPCLVIHVLQNLIKDNISATPVFVLNG